MPASTVLKEFVAENNRWIAIFGSEPMTFPLSQHSANELMNRLAADLSPENLHCDGEITPRQAKAKAVKLYDMVNELEQYCLNNWLDTPVCSY